MNGVEATASSTGSGDLAWSDASLIHDELAAAKTLVYDPCGFVCSLPIPEAESAAYAAYRFTVDGLSIRFRAAKTTPTKIGQFVTVWQRTAGGPIRPFDAADPVDLIVVSARHHHHVGQFVFPMDVLRHQDVVSTNGSGGKRGFRVYPPWVTTTNRQAGTAQAWQVRHFLSLGQDGGLDSVRARALYGPVKID